MKAYKICLVCSAGGHLNQIKELIEPLSKISDLYLVTLDREDSRTLLKSRIKHYFIRDIRDNGSYSKNMKDSLKIFRSEKPDYIITTGAGAALATCILGKLFFKKVIFIESFARVEEPSTFGKLIYRFANSTLYQWIKLGNFYKKGLFAGSIFNIDFQETEKKANQVFVTVGSTEFQFNRLLQKIDELIESGIIKDKVIAQIGNCDYKPRNFEHFKWCNFDTMQNYLMESRYTITHSGTGSIVNAIQLGAKVVAVPRLQKFNEHIDNHQLEIAQEFQQQGLVLCSEVDNLDQSVKDVKSFKPSGNLSNKLFFEVLFNVLKLKKTNSSRF